jgi:hypothetical protein
MMLPERVRSQPDLGETVKDPDGRIESVLDVLQKWHGIVKKKNYIVKPTKTPFISDNLFDPTSSQVTSLFNNTFPPVPSSTSETPRQSLHRGGHPKSRSWPNVLSNTSGPSSSMAPPKYRSRSGSLQTLHPSGPVGGGDSKSGPSSGNRSAAGSSAPTFSTPSGPPDMSSGFSQLPSQSLVAAQHIAPYYVDPRVRASRPSEMSFSDVGGNAQTFYPPQPSILSTSIAGTVPFNVPYTNTRSMAARSSAAQSFPHYADANLPFPLSSTSQSEVSSAYDQYQHPFSMGGIEYSGLYPVPASSSSILSYHHRPFSESLVPDRFTGPDGSYDTGLIHPDHSSLIPMPATDDENLVVASAVNSTSPSHSTTGISSQGPSTSATAESFTSSLQGWDCPSV